MKSVYKNNSINDQIKTRRKSMAEHCFAMYKEVSLSSRDFVSVSEIAYCDVNLLLREARSGNTEAMLELGFMFENGILFDADSKKALSWYEKGAKRGNADCQLALFYMYRFNGDIESNVYKAVFWLKLSAEKGNVIAMFILGQVFIDGIAENIDIQKGLYWIEKSALAGYCNAMLYLGDIAEKGLYFEANMMEAYKWYSKAAVSNLADAPLLLAQLVFREFSDNKGFIKKAVYFLNKAAKTGNHEAEFMLGSYYKSLGEEYYKRAFTLMKKSADAGENILAVFEVAEMYELGCGVKANSAKAHMYYSKVLDLMQ